MTLYLPIADGGNIIFLVLVLAAGLIQWLAGLKRKSPRPGDTPDPFGGPRQSPSQGEPDPSWDDLMDALGGPPKDAPPPIPKVQPLRRSIPPPPPAAKREEPARSPLSTPFGTLEAREPDIPVLSDHLKTLLAAMEQPRTMAQPGMNLSPVQKSKDIPTVTARSKTAFSRMLREPGQLRRAVVLQEILQPPLALR